MQKDEPELEQHLHAAQSAIAALSMPYKHAACFHPLDVLMPHIRLTSTPSGAPMAANLLKAGYRVVVYDRNPDALAKLAAQGAQVASSPQQIGEAEGTAYNACGTWSIEYCVAWLSDLDVVLHAEQLQQLQSYLP